MENKGYVKQRLFIFAPYLAVLLGLYLFKNAFVSISIYHTGILLSLIFIKSDYSIKELFKFKNKLILVGTIITCSLSGLVLLVLWDYIKLPGLDLPFYMSSIGLTGFYKILFLIYFSTIHPILEESYWRFYLKPSTKIISLDDILFSAYHSLVLILFLNIWFVILCFITLILVSSFWRYIRYIKGENLIVVLSHAIADFSLMFVILTLY